MKQALKSLPKGAAKRRLMPRGGAARQATRIVASAAGKSDAWERQARDVAARAIHGEHQLARRITPAAAASFRVPASSGRPLPLGVRAEMESFFGADLSAVRIHTGAAAARAALSQGAVAMASGRDIYFQAGRFAPGTEAGGELLAHEIVHVLQQTGRVNSFGVLAATEAAAEGSVQYEDMPDFATLRALHAQGVKSQEKYQEAADLILAALNKAGQDATVLDQFVTDNLGKMKDWDWHATGLLYDVLKSHGRYDSAAQLIERDDFNGGLLVLTALADWKIRKSLEARNGGEGVYEKVVEKHWLMKKYQDEFVASINRFMLQLVGNEIPDLRRQDLPEGSTSEATLYNGLLELYHDLKNPKKLSRNEWFYEGLKTFHNLDRWRKARLTDINNAAVKAHNAANEPYSALPPRFAQGVSDWADDFLASTKGADGVAKVQ